MPDDFSRQGEGGATYWVKILLVFYTYNNFEKNILRHQNN
jgi:hypothetical protein